MAFYTETGKHSQQNGFAICEFAEELPFTVANSHKEKWNNLSVSQVIVPPSCPVPDVAPQDSVQFEECSFGTDMPVIICPSGDNWVKVTD